MSAEEQCQFGNRAVNQGYEYEGDCLKCDSEESKITGRVKWETPGPLGATDRLPPSPLRLRSLTRVAESGRGYVSDFESQDCGV